MTNKTFAQAMGGGGGSYPDSPRDQEYNYNQSGEQFVWETHHVHLARVPGYGFGIAISGGIDNPHFPNGDPAIAVCDVLNAGPAAGKIEVNDRIISVDNHPLENVYHATAISMLNNSPDTISLVLRRKVYLDIDDTEPAPLKIVMKKKSKRDEYGLVLGCRLYVKKIVGNSLAAQEGGLKEGDVILKMNNITSDNLSLAECHRMMERSRDKLSLIVVKDPQSHQKSYSDLLPKIDNTHQSQSQHFDHSAEGTVTPERQMLDEAPVRPPLPDQFDQSPRDGPPPYFNTDDRSNYGPRLQPVGSSDREHDVSNLDEKDVGMSRRTRWNPEPRRISFKKSKGGVGIRLAGGNNVGIYIAAVQPDTVAHEQGLQEGDMLLRINNTEMKGKTREDAVLLLLSLESQVELLVQYHKKDYDLFISSNELGDSFYVRAHFANTEPENGQIAFGAGDVFHVRDTLHGGVVGSWRALLVDRNLQGKQEGVIPNKSGAEQILLTQQQKLVASRGDSLLRKSFFKRRTARRTKSLNKEGWEDAMFSQNSKFPAYENVIRKTPNFPRPVVLYGPVADIARKMLLRDENQIYLAPIRNTEGQKEGGVIKLAAIRQVVELSKHCVLDVNPNAVDRLNYAGYYPLVIYLRADSKQTVKEIRAGLAKDTQSSSKLYDESVRVEKLYSYLFSATITLTSNGTWYQRLKQLIHESRDQAIWICEKKAESDEFLVQSQSQSRLSYVSSPVSESGAEDHGDFYERNVMRWSSDPNMGANMGHSQAPPQYRRPPQYNTDFRRELKFAVEGHPPPQRHHSNPEDSYSGDYTSPYQNQDEEALSPYARPVPRHRRYQLRPDEDYNHEDGQQNDSWRAPPVPEKSVSLYGLHERHDEQPYPHAYDSETSLRSNDNFNKYSPQRPQSEYVMSPNGGYPSATLPGRRRYEESSPNGPLDRNGWDNDVLKYTRSTSNPYTKPAPIDRIKMQDIRNRGAERPMVPPKPVRSKSQNDSGRYDGDQRY